MSNATTQPNSAADAAAYAAKLRQQTVACRVRHQKLGVRRALTKGQVATIADEFHADTKVLSAAKKILDNKDPAFKAVVRIRTQANSYWKFQTAPFPEPGIRLIRKDFVEEFVRRMTQFASELNEAAAKLQERYAELRLKAEQDLGDLYNPDDYPSRIDTEFSIDWDFPAVEPPEYLKKLHPKLYEQEAAKIQARFAEAVALTEQALTTKLAELVARLHERLKPGADGKTKVFRDTAVANLNAFFEQFRNLDIGSSSELQTLVDQAKQAVAGVTAADLRDNPDVRATVGEQLAKITADIDGMIIDKPNRAFFFDDEEEQQAVSQEGAAA